MFQFQRRTVHVAILSLLLTPIVWSRDRVDAPTTRPATQPTTLPFTSPVFEDIHDFHRIIILCDGSGSMINKMAALKSQMYKAIDSLSADQSFNVVFFSDRTTDQPAKELMPASSDNKTKVYKFLKETLFTGTTDPIPGIEEAFREKPDVIYFLEDGDFPDNEAVVRVLSKLNKETKAKIYTVALLDEGDNEPEFLRFFKKLAADGGGKFRKVDVENLPG